MRPWNFRPLRILLSAGLVALAGCLDDPSPTDPSSTNPGVEPSAGRVPLDPPVGRAHEAPFYEISRDIKGFGGYFYEQRERVLEERGHDQIEIIRDRSPSAGTSRDRLHRRRTCPQLASWCAT